MNTYYVDTQEQLEKLCDRLKGTATLALDTEFMREKTYYSQLCLLQLANEELVVCVDPIVIKDLSPLLDIIYDPNILKVMHAARQDLEIFYYLRGDLPRPLFDTQLAATLLGYGDQVSYSKLVRDMFSVDLEKSHTRTNWSQRPLDSGQVRYAEDDVRYLVEMSHKQRRRLVDMDRLDWLDEDFNDLTDKVHYNKPPAEAWRRIRGIRVLKGVQLAALQELANWREQRAVKLDKPRKWIVRDDVIVDLSRHMPTSLEAMRRLRGLDAHIVKNVGQEIISVIQRVNSISKDDWPMLGFRFSPSLEQDAIIDAMMGIVRQLGLKNSVSPAALTTRRELEQLVDGSKDLNILHGWRGRLVGQELLAFLEGERSLRVISGVLSVGDVKA